MTTPNTPTGEKIAILGASGLVGSAVVRHLTDRGLPVVAVVRNALSASIAEVNAPNSEVRIGSVERDDTRAALIGDCPTIINCAIAGSSGVPALAYSRNRAIVDGALASPGIRRLIHFSSVAVYGETFAGIQQSARHFDTPEPNSEYGRSKLDVEQYARKLAQKQGVEFTCVRLGHVYGPTVGRSREILDLLSTPGFELPFGGRNFSNAVHIDAVAQAIEALVAVSTGPVVANLFEPDHTWRRVFDWHADVVGLAHARDMTEAASVAGQRAHLDKSVVKAAVRWSKSLPINNFIRSPAVFDFVLRNLARSPAWLTDTASGLNRKIKRGAAPVPATTSQELWPTLYFSEGAPGPMLAGADRAEASRSEAERRRGDFANWYREITVPRLP